MKKKLQQIIASGKIGEVFKPLLKFFEKKPDTLQDILLQQARFNSTMEEKNLEKADKNDIDAKLTRITNALLTIIQEVPEPHFVLNIKHFVFSIFACLFGLLLIGLLFFAIKPNLNNDSNLSRTQEKEVPRDTIKSDVKSGKLQVSSNNYIAPVHPPPTVLAKVDTTLVTIEPKIVNNATPIVLTVEKKRRFEILFNSNITDRKDYKLCLYNEEGIEIFGYTDPQGIVFLPVDNFTKRNTIRIKLFKGNNIIDLESNYISLINPVISQI